MHEDLFLFFSRVGMGDVVLEPSSHDVCDRFGQIASAALVFRLSIVATCVEIERILPIRGPVHERRAVRILRGLIGILS